MSLSTVSFTLALLLTPTVSHTNDMEDAPPPPLESAPSEEPKGTQPSCDDTASCEAGPLLAALLRLEAALLLPEGGARDLAIHEAIQALGGLADTRAVPLLVRLSKGRDPMVRLSALSALGVMTDDERALVRLRDALEDGGAPAEAAVALPPLLAWAARHPGESAVPCPEGAVCAADEALLDVILRYTESADQEQRATRVAAIAALQDPRTISMLLRLSYDAAANVRAPAIRGLAVHGSHARVQARLLTLLGGGNAADRIEAVAALGPRNDEKITDAFFAQRRIETDDQVRAALDVELSRRALARLEALREEERLAALAAEQAPGVFDVTMRAMLTAGAGASAAVGGAAASSLVADSINPGTGGCFGAWGACAGGVSAAAITWFALGDRKLGGPDVALAASTTLAGAYAGFLIPPTIGPAATQDWRHAVYSASGGALVGAASGTVAALLTRPTPHDVAEYDLTVLGTNLLTAGALLSFAEGTDPRPLFGALIGATVLGSGGGGAAGYFLSLDAPALVHASLLTGYGLGAGLFAGAARVAWERDIDAAHVIGAGMLGSSLGLASGFALGELDLVPTTKGMVYQGWAFLDGGAVGAGAGLLIGKLTGLDAELAFTGGAAGAVVGAASTAIFPDGIEQDYGDLLLQPLFVGFGLYHGGLLTGFATEDASYTTAAALLTPALASAGLVYAAPFIRAGSGDVLMVASMMGFGAYLSSMGLLSASMRSPSGLPGWSYVLGTSLAMDVGLLAGVGLNLLDVDQLGWRTTYVAAVAAGTTLIVSLPGALFASRPDSPVKVPDVLLAATLLGAGIGFATMPLIDFRIAPDFGLGKRPGDGDAPTALSQLSLAPTMVAFSPLRDEDATMGFGFAGRF